MPLPAPAATRSCPSMPSSLYGKCHRAATFLAARPMHRLEPGLMFMRLTSDPMSSCLRAHYHAGLVHAGCEAWDTLDLFDTCLVVPCLAAGPIAVAARKKGLLVR
jgi:hypothetical protein